MADTYRVSIERLENGFEVTVPDVPAIEKAEAAVEKDKTGDSVYTGDLTKSYAAGSLKEVLKLVESALKGIPEREYESAFAEAADEANK
jgi:hypothetical protein